MDDHRPLRVAFVFPALVAAALAAGASPQGAVAAPLRLAAPAFKHPALHGHRSASGLIQHVVVIVQENRSVDNIFNGFPGADTQNYGYDSYGRRHTLRQISFALQCDPLHTHPSFVADFNNGGMNGWNNGTYGCQPGSSLPDGVFAMVNPQETQAYWQVASNYALADGVFQANEGPSLPAHQYLIAGQSGGHGTDAPWALSENGNGSSSHLGPRDDDGSPTKLYCGSEPNQTVEQIDLDTPYPGYEGNYVVPCKDYETIFDLAMAQGLTWKYYVHKVGSLWSGVDVVNHLWQNPAYRAIVPETVVLTDIANHQLANIVYVTPSPANSDHPHSKKESPYDGPNWVASVVNAIGNDPYYWGNTTILIVWDDWGGWFDHVATTHPFSEDPYEWGFRVPLIVVSPYVNAHMVDHTPRNFDSIIAYIESTYGLGNLGMQDTDTDDLGDMFDYSQSPLQFVPMPVTGRGATIRR